MNTKKFLWNAAVTAAILIVLVAGFYAEENARGLHAWQHAARVITAKGESLDWNDFIPKPIPDNQNFYKAPMVTEWFTRTTNVGTAPLIMANPDTTSEVIDEISASNYLAWTATLAPQFSQIRDALKRPGARLDGNYTGRMHPLPNFMAYRPVSQVLAHSAKCHLLLSEPVLALADLTLLHDFNHTLVQGRDPALVSAMIHVTINELITGAIAYGLDSHAWHEPELAALQQELGDIHLPTAVANALRGGRASMCHLLDTFSVDEIMTYGHPKSGSDLGWWFVPRGWIDQNKALIIMQQQTVLDCYNSSNHTLSAAMSKTAEFDMERALKLKTPGNFIAEWATPNILQLNSRVARVQTKVDQAQIACALERFWIANGKYPATLAALSPQYLAKIPNDVITGKPMNYRRKDEQHFLLYSVGWNEADDGGITAHKRDGSEDPESGDWVWP